MPTRNGITTHRPLTRRGIATHAPLILACIGILVASSTSAHILPGRTTHTHLGIDALVGAPVNVTTTLEIRQDGEETLDVDASYRSEPFEMPIYWAVRLRHERKGKTWSLELMHDKLFLEDPPDEIRAFAITHGFNFLTVQRAWLRAGVQLRFGLGAVLAHPENIVRGRELDEGKGILGTGYHVAGSAAIAGVGRRVPIAGAFSLVMETRVSVAPVSVPVAGGDARFTHVAVHVLVGFGGITTRRESHADGAR